MSASATCMGQAGAGMSKCHRTTRYPAGTIPACRQGGAIDANPPVVARYVERPCHDTIRFPFAATASKKHVGVCASFHNVLQNTCLYRKVCQNSSF